MHFIGECEISFVRSIKRASVYDSRPHQVALGTFNKDKYLDLVVANSGTDCVGILLGYGNGTFATQITYSTGLGSRPYSVGVGDFNNDTKLDIVVANYGTNSIGVLLGYDDESFAKPIFTPLGSSRPLFLALGDLNNDKRLDIAVTRGWLQLRHNLVQDLAALNMREMILWDTWGILDDNPIPADQAVMLDRMAAVTRQDNPSPAEIAALYRETPEAAVPGVVTNYNPAAGPPTEVSV